MLLRSSSTPILGSLLFSISESPNNDSTHHHSHAYELTSIIKHHHPPTSFPHTRSLSFQMSPGSLHRTNLSCSSPPGSGISAHGSFRRAQSEDNLQGLALDSSNEESCTLDQRRKMPSRNNKCFMLETIPSFSFHGSSARYEEEDEESDIEEGEEIAETQKQVDMESSQKLMALNDGHEVKTNMVLGEQVRSMTESTSSGDWKTLQSAFVGLGTDTSVSGGNGEGGGGGGRGDFNHGNGGGGGGGGGESGADVEEHYRRMVEENPGEPLFLRNYAQFLYESKRELERADEYYCRAILADPKDGEILSQYAKLVWELHQDEGRALSYHERAVQAAPQDSHVHAAYASFLWDTEEDDEGCETPAIPQLHRAAAAASA